MLTVEPAEQPATPRRPSAIALNVKARRVRHGMSQQEVADRTGGALTKSAISMIESGAIADPGITKIIALARVFGCGVGELVETTEEAQGLLDEVGIDDPDRRAKSLLLLQYWDDLSEEQLPTALKIMQVLATERSP